MLPKKLRLKKAREITAVIKQGAKLRGKHLLLQFLENEQGHLRAAVGAAKKLKLSGVQRNYRRRQLYSLLSEAGLDCQNYDLFLVLLAIPEGKVYDILQQELTDLIKKLK